MTDENILIVRNDLKTYFYTYDGVAKAVDGVNFTIKKGESFGLVGETGCGKSVTAHSIMGVIDPPGRIKSGEVLFNGENLLAKSEAELQKIRGKSISMVYQDPMSCLDPVFTVGDQLIELVQQHEAVPKKEAQRRSIDIIHAVQIPDAAEIMKRYAFELSGGM
jgi:ABC-type dipeptide/oligopeptide/nickel transport system ATPase component